MPIDGPFAAMRRYGVGPDPLLFDFLTLPFQILNTFTGAPPLEIPVFGQVAPGILGVEEPRTTTPTASQATMEFNPPDTPNSSTLRLVCLVPTDSLVTPDIIGASLRQGWADAIDWMERASGSQLRRASSIYYAYGPWTTQEVHESPDRDALIRFVANKYYKGGFKNLTGDTYLFVVFESTVNPFAFLEAGWGMMGSQGISIIFPGYLKYPAEYGPYDYAVAIIIHELSHAAFGFHHEGTGSIMLVPFVEEFKLSNTLGTGYTDQQALAIASSVYAMGQRERTVFIRQPEPPPVSPISIEGGLEIQGLDVVPSSLGPPSIVVGTQTFRGVRVSFNGIVRSTSNTPIADLGATLVIRTSTDRSLIRFATLDLPTLHPGATASLNMSVDIFSNDPAGDFYAELSVGTRYGITLRRITSAVLGTINPTTGISIEGTFGV